jgi:hypothetical protein
MPGVQRLLRPLLHYYWATEEATEIMLPEA